MCTTEQLSSCRRCLQWNIDLQGNCFYPLKVLNSWTRRSNFKRADTECKDVFMHCFHETGSNANLELCPPGIDAEWCFSARARLSYCSCLPLYASHVLCHVSRSLVLEHLMVAIHGNLGLHFLFTSSGYHGQRGRGGCWQCSLHHKLMQAGYFTCMQSLCM